MTWNRNRLTEKLGIDYPIIQGPLGGLSSQKLTAAASNFGGLGSFGALNLSPEDIKNVISQIRSLTAKPFAVNLWVSMEDEGARSSDETAFNRSLAPLASYFDHCTRCCRELDSGWTRFVRDNVLHAALPGAS
jgi:nitronate monooxygenase